MQTSAIRSPEKTMAIQEKNSAVEEVIKPASETNAGNAKIPAPTVVPAIRAMLGNMFVFTSESESKSLALISEFILNDKDAE